MLGSLLLIFAVVLMIWDTASAQQPSRLIFDSQSQTCKSISAEVVDGKAPLSSSISECKKAFDIAENLPASSVRERIVAYGDYGWTFLYDQKFADALALYSKELQLALRVTPQDPKLVADAYFDIARAQQGLGKGPASLQAYIKAEAGYRKAYASSGSADERAEAKKLLRRVLILRKYLASFSGDVKTWREVEKSLRDLDSLP